MANTAEQMEVFGYTPEGLDQEVEKYTGEAKKDFEESKLEEERRANHPLNNVPFFQRPVNASTDDIEVPTSDPDVRAFKNKFGETYTIATSPDQRVEREKLRDGIISSLEGIKGYLENPFLPDKEQVVDFVKGAAVGTLEQIKQSMESGATYGDIFGTLAGVGAASTPFKVPKDSLRLFGGVSMEGAAKDKNLKKAIGLLKDSDFYKFNRPASEEGGISYDLNKKIWSQTGWYVDPADGQWRYFIDDTKASLKNLDKISNIKISPNRRKPVDWVNIKISDIFDHPEFYKKYPEFKDFEVYFYNADRKNSDNVNFLGSYDEFTDTLGINIGAASHMSMVGGKFVTNPDAIKKTLLHELQHVIQRKENFVRGASSDNIPPDLVYDKDRELRGKKKPIQKEFDKAKSEFDRIDNRLREARKAAGENPLPGLTIQQEIEIYNKHYSQPDKLRPDVTWASTAREYGVPVSIVQKAAGRTNLIGRLNRKLKQQGKVYNKLADEVYDVDRERSRVEINFYEGAGGEIEARLTEDMLDNPNMFPIDARADMLEREGNLYEYQGKYGVDPFNYEVKPRREPESTNLIDTVKKKFGVVDNVKPLTTAEKESLSADFQRIIDPSVNDNPDVFKLIFLDDEYAREILAEFRSPTRDITGDPAKLSEVKSLRNEIYNLTQEGLKDLPEEVTVYRYGPLNERDGVTSFTLNPLYGGSDPSLHLPWVSGKDYELESYTVKKSDILAAPDLIRDFGEAEVIIKNDAVKKLKNFAEGGDTVRPEPKPETRPFPDVKPKARPDSDEYRGRTYDIYSVEIDGKDMNVIEFKDGKRISSPQILQMFAKYASATETFPGERTSKEILKFLEDNNPTYDEFVRHFTAKRLNKGGMIGEQMRMSFMNEGGVVDKDYGVADLSDERVVKKLEGWLNSSGSTKEIAEKALAGEVVNQEFLTKLTKPTTQELAKAAGIDENSEEYKKLSDMYNTGTFNQRDIRDWNKIMKSDDPYKATQIATRQVIESGAYDKNPRDKGREEFPSSLYNSVTPAPKGQMGITSINRPTGKGRDNYQDHLMTPGGRRLTQIVDTGNDEITRQNQLERFGYNLSPEEVSKESYLNPYMEKDIYYGIDWNPNTLDSAIDNKNKNQKVFLPVSLMSPQGVRAIAYTQEQLNMYLSMGYKRAFNEGGMAMDNQMQMAFMNEGGLTDDGMNTDPVSGNDIPSGSMAEEVRDDIPAQLSEGEYVVPADVVRYYGVKFFEDLRDRAKRGLAEMEANGRIGGEPVPAGGPINNEDLSPEEMQAIQEMMGMSQGGAIGNLNQQQQILQEPANKAIGNSQMMYGGGQVRGYQNSSLVTQAQSNLLGGQSQSQVEQQMLSAAGNKPYIGQPLGFSLFGSSNTGVKQDQSQTSTFTPMVLYNKAGQSRSVSSEEEKAKAIADGYTMTLEQYNMYRSQSGGSGSGGSTITPPGGEDGEPKPWGQDLKNWNDVDDIKQFVAQAERGNLSGSGRFLRGAGFAIAGLPGALLAGAFQSFKGLNSLYDMEAAQIIAEAKGKAGSKEHADLAVEIQKGIDTYLEKAGGIVNFAYKPRSKNVMNKVNGVFVGTGYDDLDSWAAGTRRTTIADFAATTTKNNKSTKASQNILDKRKGSGMGPSKVTSKVFPTADGATRVYTSGAKVEKVDPKAGDTSAAGMKAAKESLKDRKINIGGRNKGGLMTKGKKKK